MKLFGLNIGKVSEINNLKKKVGIMEDHFYKNRPNIDFFETVSTNGVHIPYFPLQPNYLYDIALYCDTVRTIHLALKRELFRRGFEIVPKIHMNDSLEKNKHVLVSERNKIE